MKRMLFVAGVAAVLGSTIFARAQAPAPPRRVVGHEIGGRFDFDAGTQMTTATATLGFSGVDAGPALTVDFVTRFHGPEPPASAPALVDMIVTEHPAGEDAPAMSLRIDDAPLQLVARVHSRRSVATTIPFDEFLRLTSASTLVEQAFGTELEFSGPQLKMLHARAERWSGSHAGAGRAPASAVDQSTVLEVRLAESAPDAGLSEAAVPGSGETIYLHAETIITNADVAGAQVIPGDRAGTFNVGIRFTGDGSARMEEATQAHLNKPLAILVNGRVVAAPILRSEIRRSAVITGDFTKAEADAIAAGMNPH